MKNTAVFALSKARYKSSWKELWLAAGGAVHVSTCPILLLGACVSPKDKIAETQALSRVRGHITTGWVRYTHSTPPRLPLSSAS